MLLRRMCLDGIDRYTGSTMTRRLRVVSADVFDDHDQLVRPVSLTTREFDKLASLPDDSAPLGRPGIGSPSTQPAHELACK
jgi:hypothetical protein